MAMGMNIFFMIQAIFMMAFYLVAGVVVIILMIKGIQALNVYMKKAKLEIQALQSKESTQVAPPVYTSAVKEETTEDK